MTPANSRFSLAGQTALIVGGRGLLGSRFAAALRQAGATVYAADRIAKSRAARQAPGAAADGIRQRQVDVTRPASVDRLVRGIVKEAGRLDILVYCATTKPRDFYAPYTACSLAGWQRLLRVELDGLFLVTQRVGRVMERAGRGSIILMGSIYGLVGNDQRLYQGSNLASLYAGATRRPGRRYSYAGYAAAKGAAAAMARYLAAYWGEKGIRVNCVSPGGIAHPGEDRGFVRRYCDRVPLGRKAGLDEINGAIVYLASAASSYVTGHNLVVDGGWTAW